jgi:hypothetical protein
MKIKIRATGALSTALVHTVLLAKDVNDPEATSLFSCYRCAQPIGQIQGRLVGMIPGLIPSEDVAFIHRCRQCKEMYVFQTHPTKILVWIPITLSALPGYNMLHCMLCHSPLVNYSMTAHPNQAICEDCHTKYRITDVISITQ